MLCSFATLVSVSQLSKFLFEAGHLPPHLDYFNCVVNIPEDIVKVQEPQEELTVLNSSMFRTLLFLLDLVEPI